MRITNQMLAKTALKSGIPLQQNSLLNIMTKEYQSEENGLLSKIGKTKDDDLTSAALKKLKSQKTEKLQINASSLSEFASKLNASGEKSLYADAVKNESTENIITNVQGLVDSYNNTLDQLKKNDGELNKFYMEEMQSYVSEHKDALASVGVTAGADGKLVIDEEKLKSADVETLEKVFGSTSGFTDKLGYVGGRVAEKATASDYAFLNQYNKNGLSNLESYVANHYNFWG
ncbi:MAG: hypothetical protein NC307_05650 [Roseburia sp.]|nr:hypothetical protein [Roseburia sp.]